MRWRQFLSSLLCLLLLSGSVSGAHLHICGHEDVLAASLQIHTPQHLELHLADKDGAADLDVELLAGMLKKLERLDPGTAAVVRAMSLPPSQDSPMQAWVLADPPDPAGRPARVLPPLRAPPHSFPA